MKLIKRSEASQPSSLRERSLFDLWNDMNDSFWRRNNILEDLEKFNPDVDLSETEKEIKVRANVPGISLEDINIEVEEDGVFISGKVDHSEEEEKENYYRVERKTGSFSRDLRLPGKIDPNSVKAKIKDGVLSITMKKIGGKSKKKVKIEK